MHNNTAINGVCGFRTEICTTQENSGATGFCEAQNIPITGNSYVTKGAGPVVDQLDRDEDDLRRRHRQP